MNTQTLILGILNFEDVSGYEIKKMSTEGVYSHFVDISFGSIYPTLSKLEAEGLVTCRAESQNGRPDKKVYSITEKGRMEFVATLAQPPQPDKFKSEFLLVAMCASQTNSDVIEAAIDKRLEELKSKIEMIETSCADCDHPATVWVANYGLHIYNTDISYLEANRDTLLSLAGSELSQQAAE